MANLFYIFGILIAVTCAAVIERELDPSEFKPEQRVHNSFYKLEWDPSEYIGRLPSLRVGPNHEDFDDEDFENKPVTFQGPTSMFALEINGEICATDCLTSFFTGSSYLSEFASGAVGLVHEYTVPWPESANAWLEVLLITEVIADDEDNNYVAYAVVTHYHENDEDFDFPEDYEPKEDGFEGNGEWEDDSDTDGQDPIRPIHDKTTVKGTIKVRFLVDVDVGGDDGGFGYSKDNNYSPHVYLEDTYVTGHPSFFIFGDTARDDEDDFYIGFDTKGPRTGPDRMFYAYWRSAFQDYYTEPEPVYSEAEGEAAQESGDPFYYHGLPTSLMPGDITSDQYIDDSALLIYFDGSNCWGPEGYPVIANHYATFVVKVFAFDYEPSLEQCPYCPSNIWDDDRRRGAVDTDFDWIDNDVDRCPTGPGNQCDRIQFDIDGDYYPDACDYCPLQIDLGRNQDSDNDGYGDNCDNCPEAANEDQEDSDGDEFGNACDNCEHEANNDQADWDYDNIGDVCDNCPEAANEDQENDDGDSYGNVCDNCPEAANDDQKNSDTDSFGDACDNCIEEANEDQTNSDTDSFGDACDNCPDEANEDQDDFDGDLIGSACDNCAGEANADQEDYDGDGFGDVCDNCPEAANEGQDDSDGDLIGNVCDNCEGAHNPDQEDYDYDGYGDACDNCAEAANEGQEDVDGDMIGDICDNCPDEANHDQKNSDSDHFGDACDNCPEEANESQADEDDDNAGDACDNCPGFKSADTTDNDNDGYGNPCDSCKNSIVEHYYDESVDIDGEAFENIEVPGLPGCKLTDFEYRCDGCAATEPTRTNPGLYGARNTL